MFLMVNNISREITNYNTSHWLTLQELKLQYLSFKVIEEICNPQYLTGPSHIFKSNLDHNFKQNLKKVKSSSYLHPPHIQVMTELHNMKKFKTLLPPQKKCPNFHTSLHR